MIKFNELSITKEFGIQYLNIDVSVLKVKTYFDMVYISRVIVIKASDYTTSYDPLNATDANGNLIVHPYDTGDISDDGYKDWSESISAAEMNGDVDLENDMFFVYVYTTGTPDDVVCCNIAKTYDVGLVFNSCKVYNAIMQNIKQLDCNSCELPTNFNNIYINYMAIKYAIMTCNYTDAIARYNKMFNRNSHNSVSASGCGCGNSN